MACGEADKSDCTEPERLQKLLAWHEVALSTMSHGLCMYDAEQRVVLFNQRFLDYYHMSPDAIRRGTQMRTMFVSAAGGLGFAAADVEAAWAKRQEQLAAGKPFRNHHELPDGRTIAVYFRPMDDGGWVAVYEDVTRQQTMEQELRLQFERTQQAISNMSVGLCMFDADERLIVCNDRYLQLYDLDPAVVQPGIAHQALLHHWISRGNQPGVTTAQFYEQRMELVRSNETRTMRLVRKDGRIVEATSRPLPNGGWVSAHEDVTDRLRQEEALSLQNLRFDAAIENLSHGLCMFDANQRLIVCNARYCNLYDLDPEVAKPGISYRDLLDHWCSRSSAPMLSPQEMHARRLAAIGRNDAFTVQIPLRNGRVIQATTRPTPNGGWVSASDDVTARLRQEEALREQNVRFDAAIENMGQGLCLLDQDLRILVCNRRYLDMYGFDPAIVKPGVSMLDVMRQSVALGNRGNASPEELLERFRQRLHDQEPWFIAPQGNGRTHAIRHQRMANGGWVVTYEDITERQRAAEAMGEQNLRFDAALNNMSQGLAMFDANQRLIVCNDKYITIFRADPNVVKPGITLREVFEHGVACGLYAEAGLSVDDLLARRMAALRDPQPGAYDQQVAGGRIVSVSICPMANGGWVGTFEDVTENRRLEAERAAALKDLRDQRDRFNTALDNMSHGLVMLDPDLRVIVCNRRYLEIFNMSPDVVKPGITMRAAIEHSVAVGNYPGCTADERYAVHVERLHSGTGVYQRKLASGRVIQFAHQPMAGGGWVVTYEDITERHEAEERISHMARHDALTGLPNRVLFREKMADGIARVEERGETMAVLCLDLDNFKAVNDTLGHPIGDRLLTVVAQRLGSVVGPHATIARLGGDEFAILQSDCQLPVVEAMAARIVKTLDQPVTIDGHEINTGVSIGVAVAPCDGVAADHLMKCADLALYRAKAEGRGRFRFFESDMDTRLQEKRTLELDLRKALAGSEFDLVYQPQVRASDCELTGMEALLRWNHAERGSVSPAEFIPIAEETGLIIPLGEWALRRACAEAARWPLPIKVAVNLSPAQFKGRGLLATVTSALAAAGLAPNRLELEITEAVLLQDDDMTHTMLHQLRTLGVRISMDDFGTGYSSLSYLRSFPFDKIKIDRSFVSDLDRGKDSAAIIRAVAGLGASLGIETTAEGVETAEQFERVRRDGCTEIQGYYFSRPRPAAEVFELFADRWRSRAVA